MVAEVIINSNVKTLNKTFDYEIPKDLNIKIGSRVFVPFGNQKDLAEGIVINIKEKSEYKVKPISGLQDEQISDIYLSLAKWISKMYFCNLSDSLKLMLPPGKVNKDISKRVKEKIVNQIKLIKSQDEILKDIEEKKIKSEKQIRVLNFLIDNSEATMQDIKLFTDCEPYVVDSLVKKGYLEKEKEKVERNPFLHKVKNRDKKLKFTDEQKIAFEKIKEPKEYLLYGVTGSGKTEIYLQLIEKMLEQGKSSIMLVPEISLTPQTVDRFIARFGDEKIAVLHSKLSIGERYDSWCKIKEGKAKIIIGARSAIFAPAKNLGLIIIDEEHDESYKSESTPRYDAKKVAEFLMVNMQIPVVLGSATPDMETFYKAKTGKIELLTLTKRANNAKMPKVEIVDLRDELANGNKNMLSFKLQDEIRKNLENKKQTILYLNRRGFSTFVMCNSCGEPVKCKRCNITLTYHKQDNKLKCHYCGFEENVITRCPSCGSNKLSFFGAGTQKLEDEVHILFPNATTIRMDVDTVTKKNSHEQILEKFRNENIDILIGTQMVVKGHHFPNVTLVGAVAADTNLNIGDYRATERTFQTLTQVEGRAGRGEEEGRAIIQTYNPDNYAIEYAKDQNYDEFFDTEIKVRKALKYPPFCDIILLAFSSKNVKEMQMEILKIYNFFKDKIKNENLKIILYNPCSSPIDKIKDRYRMRIIIKCNYSKNINIYLNEALKIFINDKLKFTRMQIQVNPNNML